ncbi:MAG: class I SAM-dependent methyltransferase [Candidatus Sulfotelmatobacter sp.]
MNRKLSEVRPPLSGAAWAVRAETYAALICEHLSPDTIWLDAGCGGRLLEDDLDPLEDWLVDHCRFIVGMDVTLAAHRNVKSLVSGSIYALPFADDSIDLVTCNMVVEHLDRPGKAFAEVARCLRPSGAFIVHTPNLLNYGIFGNAVASKLIPEKWRLRVIHGTDDRKPEDFFPVRYKANTMRRLLRLLDASGFEVHRRKAVPQLGPFFRKTWRPERFFMKLTPNSGLLVCAHKRG